MRSRFFRGLALGFFWGICGWGGFSRVQAQAQPVTQPETVTEPGKGQEAGIFTHYQKFDIDEIRGIEEDMRANPTAALGKLQNLLSRFYRDHPARPVDVEDLDPEVTLRYQQDPRYAADRRRQGNLEKLRKKQSPGLIKNAPNLFEMHLAMARGLRDVEKGGILFTKSPFRSSYHFLTALRYRTLKLTPEVWLDPDRLKLLHNDRENTDAEAYQKAAADLANARLEYEKTRRTLYTREDNAVTRQNDPGYNPDYKTNQDTLARLRANIADLETKMLGQAMVFEAYAKTWNKESANVLLEFAEVVNSVDLTLRDQEKILNQLEYYRSNYDGTFKQTWQLASKKAAWINLLETASLLDPENPLTPVMLGREYKSAGEDTLAISSFEKALQYDKNTGALTDAQRLEIYTGLGGLYYNSRLYVDSAINYERAWQMNKTDELEFQLARIHAENTGNYERARELFEDLAGKSAPPGVGEEPLKAAAAMKLAYTINSSLADIYEKMSEDRLALETLKKSATLHVQLENLILKNYDLLRTLEKNLVELRVAFNREPTEVNMQSFYQAQQDYRNQKNILQNLESLRRSMNLQKTYFGLARRHEHGHNIQAAVEAYRQAESFGLAPDEARREITRLQKEYFQ